MSQNQRILNYLKSGKKLTPLEALKRFGSFRLSGRIYDLKKKEGHPIKREMVWRNGKRVARYYMEKAA